MIYASVYLLVFIRILFVHHVEKILLLQPLNFGGITPPGPAVCAVPNRNCGRLS